MAIKINNVEIINDSRELVNITNLKTINGQSITGSGDITVSSQLPTSSVDNNNQRIINLADPTSNQDATTKKYVDSAFGSKKRILVKTVNDDSTTIATTLSGLQTINGVSLVAGDKVMISSPNSTSQRGVYIVSSGAWTKDPEFESNLTSNNMLVIVEYGFKAGTVYNVTHQTWTGAPTPAFEDATPKPTWFRDSKYQGSYSIGMENNKAVAGMCNISIGNMTLANTSSVNSTVSIGDNANAYTVSGYGSVAIGDSALKNGNASENSIAVGSYSMSNMKVVSYSVALGDQALKGSGNNNQSSYDIAIGSNALYSISGISQNNIAIGQNSIGATTGTRNQIAIGKYALNSTTSSVQNIAIGENSLRTNTTGIYNTVIGVNSGNQITTGSRNTIVGSFTGNSGDIDIRQSNNNIILSDGSGTPRLHIDEAGATTFYGSFRSVGVNVAALDINCALGNCFTKLISSNSTFTFSNVPINRVYSFTIEIDHQAGSITWPTSVRWPGDTAPILTVGKIHLFMFVTYNGGTRWRGAALVDYSQF